MSEVPRWMHRKFSFDFPTELYPNIRTRLRGTPVRLEELLRGLPSEVLVSRPNDKWSIQENAGHLLDLESLWLDRLQGFLRGHSTLTAAEITNRKTNEACHNERALADILKHFRDARGRLMDHLDALQPADFGRIAHHPRLNIPMRLVDHMVFVAEHDDHHLARIWELRHQWLAKRERQPQTRGAA